MRLPSLLKRLPHRGSLILGLLLLLLEGSAAEALPPRYRFSTLDLGRIHVHFHAEVETPARRVAALVLEILPRLEATYGVRVPSLNVVVHDANDAPNGSALSFPYPLVEIRTASVDGADSGPVDSWLRLVVTHELTHIVHLEQAGGLYGAFRHVFGRAPFLFPDALQPAWFIEGLAVREETRGTAFGRGRHALTKMVVDEAARSGQLARMSQATLGLDLWPQGQAPYLFGSEFLAWLERGRGEDAARAVSRQHARALHPYLDNRSFRDATGRNLKDLWREFAAQRQASLAPAPSVNALTSRGAVQTTPRFSPDGKFIAYVSRGLKQAGEIRLMRADGTDDRRLCERLSGAGLSWSRDGASLLFDETDTVARFESRSDLYRVETATGRRVRLTHGLRASDPDEGPIGPNGEPPEVIFVRRFEDRSELARLAPDGAVRTLTQSEPGVEWSRPRFSPSGRSVIAARMAKGFVDLVVVDPGNGTVVEVTHDRALDAEPSWLDEDVVVFRSDREGETFRLFLADVTSRRISRVVGPPDAAFSPDARAGALVFAHYSSRGYDLAGAPLVRGEAAGEYRDAFPEALPDPQASDAPAKPYSVWPSLGPRFFTPFVEPPSGEWRLGAATGSIDALSRATWGIAASSGLRSGAGEALAYLSYARFTPALTVLARRDVLDIAKSEAGDATARELRVSVEVPVERSLRRRQTATATIKWRREAIPGRPLDEAAAAFVWDLDSTRQYPLSISPQDGLRARAVVSRSLSGLGADLEYTKAWATVSGYKRAGSSVVAIRLGGGWVWGAQAGKAAFAVGGLSTPALLDPSGDDPSVLRGYRKAALDDIDRTGTRLAFGNVEWRLPLGFPQRGYRAFPFFIRHLHASLSLDAAAVSVPRLDLHRPFVGVSAGIGANLLLGHRFPVTITAGLGRGLTRGGASVPWVSLGFPF